jgi:hypothetical protein
LLDPVQPCLFSQKQASHPWLLDSALYLSDSTAVATLAFREDKSGSAFLDQNGYISNELSMPGRTIGLAKWKGNIIVFCVDQYDRWKMIKNIHAVLINIKTKAILQDQLFFTNPGKNFIVCKVIKDDQSNFGSLLVRTTGLEGNFDPNHPKRVAHKAETTALTTVYLSDAFQPVTRSLSTAPIGTPYFAAYANRKGEMAILSYAGDKIVAEKFGSDGQLQKKVTVAFPGFNPWAVEANNSSRGAFRPDNDDILVFSVMKGVFVADFGSEKAFPLETPGLNDKAYNDRVDSDPDAKKGKYFKYPGSFKPNCLFFVGDTLIFSKEIQYDQSNGGPNIRFIAAGTMVTMYDGQFHWLHQFYLDRYFESFSDGGRGWSYHVQNGRLLAFGNVITGAEHYDNICYVMDLHNYTNDLKTLEWGDGKRGDYSNIETVCWFRNNLLKNQATGREFSRHFEGRFVKIAYP